MSLNKSMLMNLTNEELIHRLDDKRQFSPIIDVLLYRLEEVLKGLPKGEDHRADCPICQTTLNISVDEGNSLYELKPISKL